MMAIAYPLALLFAVSVEAGSVVDFDDLASFGKPRPQQLVVQLGASGLPRKQEIEVEKIFLKFDRDNNNYLNRRELAEIFKETNPPESEWHNPDHFTLDRYYEFCKDLNADPVFGLNLAQLEEAYKEDYGTVDDDFDSTKQIRVLKLPPRERKMVKGVFGTYDEDSDGYLELSEVMAMTNGTKKDYLTFIAAEGADPSEGLSLMNVLRLYASKAYLHEVIAMHAEHRKKRTHARELHIAEELAEELVNKAYPAWSSVALMAILVVPFAAAMGGFNKEKALRATSSAAQWLNRKERHADREEVDCRLNSMHIA